MVQKKLMEQKAEPKRRGRPRAYDPQAAIARAAETFWKAGYAGTSLDDLVEATGMNRPSLYAAFGDKRDLYLKTLEHYRDEGRALARHALAGEPALRVFLKRFYDKALDALSRRRCRAAATRSARPRRSRRSMTACARFSPRACARPTASCAPDREGKGARRDRARRRSRRACLSGVRDLAHARDPLARRPAAEGARCAREGGDRGDLRESAVV